MVQKTPVMFTKPLIFSCLIQRVFKNCRMSAFQAVDESPVWWKESEAPPECTKGAPGAFVFWKGLALNGLFARKSP